MTMNDLPKPKRRWYQFSLRALLVFVLLVSIGMSWLTVRMQRVRKQREAVAAIEALGGWVVYEAAGRWVRYGAVETPVPAWLHELLGDDFFFLKVDRVALPDSRVTDASLEHFKELTSLKELDLRHTRGVTDAGLEHLKGLTNLKKLNLWHTQVTDAGVNELKKALPNCEIGH